MYMQVESRTSSCLHLKRAPGIRSWSLLVGKDVHIFPQVKNLTLKKDENETKLFLFYYPQVYQLFCYFVSSQPLPSGHAFAEDSGLPCLFSSLSPSCCACSSEALLVPFELVFIHLLAGVCCRLT